MAIDNVDFKNSLQTIGWQSAAVGGFEADAYGAVLMLIHYVGNLTPAG